MYGRILYRYSFLLKLKKKKKNLQVHSFARYKNIFPPKLTQCY